MTTSASSMVNPFSCMEKEPDLAPVLFSEKDMCPVSFVFSFGIR